ncbi:MAG TPA: carboxypeptidase regulatory-like domain-containing protein [Vicinamibacteria bacterium]|nr:carboxypeptidase regulatory-like domain-containing protein [Vicinamibacteria bacterium]
MKKKVLLYLGLALVLAVTAYAQTARVGGKVTDQQGGVLPGASVSITNVATGLTTEVVTNAAGSYSFPSLDPGSYRLSVAMPGFASYVREGIILVTGQGITLDAALEVEGVTETVTVTGESPMISTRESSVSGVVESEEIENVPINTRDVQQLALLVPGAKRANNFDPTKSRVPAISFGTNGSGRGILYTLDGGDNTDDAVGGIVQQVSMDSVQEFEVVTSRVKAEYARAGGGAIKIITKSGTNSFHGSAFEFFRDKSLNTETEPEKIAGEGKAPFRRHQFGGAFGGPIVQDKAFFFLTYERVQEDFNSILSVPDESLSAFDPAFIEQHGGIGLIEQPFTRNYFTAKYTQQFNPSNRLDVRYAYEDNIRDGDQVGPGFDFNRTRDYAAFQSNDLWSILARNQTLVGTAGFNEFVFQVSDFVNIIQGNGQPDFHSPDQPTLDFPSLRAGQNTNTPQKTFQRKWQFSDTFSYSLNTHDLKFGGSILKGDPFGFDLPFSNNGYFVYGNDGDPLDQAQLFTQFDLIPALEIPYTVYGGFVQDDWRLGDNLTLNLGIRYDVEIGVLSNVPYGPNGQFIITDPRSPYAGQGELTDDKNNWAPRVGFAYDVGGQGRTVVRGGYGIFYDKIVANATLFTLIDYVGVRGVSVENPPFGPDNVPGFEDLYANYGFPLPYDPVIAPGYQIPKSEQFSIGFSHQVTPTLALDADYIRSNGDERGKRSDLNERTIPGDNSSRLFAPRGGRLRIVEAIGFDTYDGLQLSLRKRFTNNLQFTFNYTLSDLRGNNESGFADEAECRACLGDERDVGPYNNHTRHNFIAGGIVLLPADFQFSGLVQAESGRPISAVSNQDRNGNGRFIADWMPGPNGEPAGRGNFLGDQTITFDLRLAKFFRFGGEKNLQVMFETFNLFNRVNKGRNFIDTFESPSFGQWDEGGLETNQLQLQLGIRFQF